MGVYPSDIEAYITELWEDTEDLASGSHLVFNFDLLLKAVGNLISQFEHCLKNKEAQTVSKLINNINVLENCKFPETIKLQPHIFQQEDSVKFLESLDKRYHKIFLDCSAKTLIREIKL